MLNTIKKIREKTGAGVVNIKKALDEAGGNEEKAIEVLRKQGHDKALKKSDREAKEGVVVSYIHSNMKIGTMVKLLCETDFVARNTEFQDLAKDIAMHIAAMNPQYLNPEEVSTDVIEKEKEIWREQLKNEGKPEKMFDKIMEGKEKKFREDISLTTQAFVKDPSLKINDILAEKIGKIGENIQIGEFVRFEL